MTTNSGSRPKKRWIDLKVVIASLALTITLYLWNVFAGQPVQTVSASADPANGQVKNFVAGNETGSTSAGPVAQQAAAQQNSGIDIFGLHLFSSASQTQSTVPFQITRTRSSRP
jgi:hypothetical protein